MAAPDPQEEHGKVVEPEIVQGPRPSSPPARGTFFHPLSGALILAVDWLAFGADIFSGFAALAAVSVAAFALTFWAVSAVQRRLAGDPPGPARLKALIGAAAAGVPFPISGTIVGAAILLLSGLAPLSRRKGTSKPGSTPAAGALLLMLLAPGGLRAHCRTCPGGGYVCVPLESRFELGASTAAARPMQCPRPERYQEWKRCLRGIGVILQSELNSAQRDAMAACQREREDQVRRVDKKCREETGITFRPTWTAADGARFRECERKHASEVSNDTAGCLKGKNVGFPPVVYEFTDLRSNPAIVECGKIEHGSE